MNGWLIAIIVIYVLGVGISIAKHGEEREGYYSAGGSFLSALIMLALVYMAIVTGL